MIGSFITRGLVMVFGYAYPAYECYKTVEKNKPEIEQLRFWCQYWILVAVLTVCERIGDAFVSWVPMYSEAKLAFFIYLWYPKTMGTTYVYDSFFRPYVAKHENEIDRNLLELKTRAGDMAVLYWQRAMSYGQTRVFDVLQYIAAQSPTTRQPQQGARARQPPAAPNRKPSTPNRQSAESQPEPEEPASPASSTSSSQHQAEVAEAMDSSTVAEPAPPGPPGVTVSKSQIASPTAETSTQSAPAEMETLQIEATVPSTSANESSSANESVNPPAKETVMEETIRVTRGRLRKSRSGPNR